MPKKQPSPSQYRNAAQIEAAKKNAWSHILAQAAGATFRRQRHKPFRLLT
jgi:hypothetical protein